MQHTFGVVGTRESEAGYKEDTSRDSNNTDNKTFFGKVRERFQAALTAESENRTNFVTDTQFSCSDDQWDAQIKRLRGANRPSLTYNLLNPVIKIIMGEYRQKKLAVKVLPANGPASEDVADILGGLIRNIEKNSDADAAYTTALDSACRGGFGYWRIVTDYTGDDQFEQDIIIKAIHNALTVYFDPSARMITREDANWAFITEMIPKDQFAKQYPDAKMQWFDGAGDNFMQDWNTMDDIRVAEYFEKESHEARLGSFSNGMVMEIHDDSEIEALAQIGIQLTNERKAKRTRIHWYKLTGAEILEEETYDWRYIPIIPCLGEEINVEGKVYLRSAIFYAKDAQRTYNYQKTTATELTALAPKTKILMTAQQLEGNQETWDNLNNSPAPYAVYNPDPQAPGPPTMLQSQGQAIGEITLAMNAVDDIKRTTGIYDASLGAQGNETSGVAIEARQNEGNTSTYIFIDNLKKGIEYGARVMLDMIPGVYDTERVVRVLDLEGQPSTETINQEIHNPLLGITEVLNGITVGKYDVVCTTGPNFASRKRELIAGMVEIIKVYPQLMQVAGDLFVKNFDIPGADQIAERIKRTLPPQITTDPDTPEGQQAMQQAQAQQQQQQQIQQQLIQSKVQAEQGKHEAAMAKASAEVTKAQAEVFKAKAEIIEKLHEHAAAKAMGGEAQPGQQGHPPVQVQFNAENALNGVLDHVKQMADTTAQHTAVLPQIIQGISQSMQQNNQHQEQQAQMFHDALQQGAQSHQQVAQSIGHLAKAISAPRKVVRDQSGRISGSQA